MDFAIDRIVVEVGGDNYLCSSVERVNIVYKDEGS